MTREEIIDMAKQAGIDIGIWEKLSDNDDVFGYDICGIHENLEAFATLVAEHERQRCAEICECSFNEKNDNFNYHATLIRARGQA